MYSQKNKKQKNKNKKISHTGNTWPSRTCVIQDLISNTDSIP